MMHISPKSKSELKMHLLLNRLTDEATKSAAEKAFAQDGFDEGASPTTIRFKKRTLIFYKSLAESLGISYQAAISLILDGYVESARPVKQSEKNN